MQILVIALGSRGDVQPYIALAKGLQQAGHTVRLLANENFKGLIVEHGLDFWPARGNPQEVAESKEMRELLEKGNFIAITKLTAKAARKAALEWGEDGLAAAQGMDLIVAGMGGIFLGIALAEKLKIAFLQAYLVPFTPTKAFPSVLLPASFSKLGGAFNHLSHHLTRQIIWQGFRAADQAMRQEVLGLPTAGLGGPYQSPSLNHTPILYGFSPSVIPKPVDWGENIHVTGYWFLDSAADWSPPADLTTFLEAGSPPIYIGFGSMVSRKPEETATLVLQAVAKSGQRAILLSGWGGLSKTDLPDTVFMVDSIPHSWLFRHVAAVVHHGGAGTTAAALRAGIPSTIIPFFADQPFWGQRIAALGVGSAPIPRKQLTVDRLAQAIEQLLTDPSMRQQAAQLGNKIQAEDGIAAAVEVVSTLKARR